MIDASNTSSESLKAGDRVRLCEPPPYFKTADPMPMLRPPGVVAVGEEGTLMDYRPGGTWSVRFTKGTFLLDAKYLETISPEPDQESPDTEDNQP
ncbi:MAG: DUF3148 domain-containing protein [Synechococcales cyanobacterium T60_A2020_003]|nr:DUF3148 domain-containing protein [Synechococcales cyanobacterium T60_A2020_003]